MAYKVIRFPISDRMRGRKVFRDEEGDLSFDMNTDTEVNALLTAMEERGWEVVSTATDGTSAYMYVTLRQTVS
ncbi:MAG: hypothetical protein LBN10_09325 [Propionibacteriaceae bacterium]|jgi:hypothetical protein|nr:hypothetical protein [Propionibacteriaceae bacterium]